MCIIGCEPKRAGLLCLRELADGQADPKLWPSILAERGITLKKIPVRLENIIPKEKAKCKTPHLTQQQKRAIAKEAELIRETVLKIPEGMVLQGALINGEGGSNYRIIMEQITSTLAKDLLYPPLKSKRGIRTRWIHASLGCTISESRIYRINEWRSPRTRVYAVYSRKDDIQSYLYGDESFTWAHWFVGDNPISYNELDKNKIPSSLEIIQVQTKEQVSEVLDMDVCRRPTKTICVFCSTDDFEKFKVLKDKIPEVFWTRASDRN